MISEKIPRSIWNGSIAFGLVDVPVKIISSTESHDTIFHQVHLADGGRVRYIKKCEDCGEILHGSDIGRAYEGEDGKNVVVDESAQPEQNREMTVLDFVPAGSVDPLQVEKNYLLQPGGGANKIPRAYRLLTAAMQKTRRDAVVRLTLRSAEKLGMLSVRKIGDVDALVLSVLFWADEIRRPQFARLDGDVPFRPAELSAANKLVLSLAAPWEPDNYGDPRQGAPTSAQPAVDKVGDLLAKLTSSKKRQKIA